MRPVTWKCDGPLMKSIDPPFPFVIIARVMYQLLSCSGSVIADHTSSAGCPTRLEKVSVAYSPSYSTFPTGET